MIYIVYMGQNKTIPNQRKNGGALYFHVHIEFATAKPIVQYIIIPIIMIISENSIT